MQRIRKLLLASDASIASTQYLADQIQRTASLRIWIHRNAFSLEMLKRSNEAREAVPAGREPGRVLIGYASGTPTHNRDFEMIRPALKQVLARYPQADLQLIGPLDPGDDWSELAERIRRQKLVPWRRLPGLLAGLDINLAPLLTDNPFAQSKSEIKYMEAALVGVPTIASPTDAFCYAIRPGENGFLANTTEEWASALSRLIEDGSLRRRVGEEARAAVMAEYHPARRAGELVHLLNEAGQMIRGSSFQLEGLAPEVIEQGAQQAAHNILAKGDWIPERYEKGPTAFQMGLFSLRTVGVLWTLQRVWIAFRRLVAPLFPFKKTGQ
jgi:glycosyltransferase involved in cell wall biosynthesis